MHDEKCMMGDWRGKGFAFFSNHACEAFPCHKIASKENFNCLFCYCPLYMLGEDCGGNYTYTAYGIKDCTGCNWPHEREGYGRIMEKFGEIIIVTGRRGGRT
jgi:Zn-finger protein